MKRTLAISVSVFVVLLVGFRAVVELAYAYASTHFDHPEIRADLDEIRRLPNNYRPYLLYGQDLLNVGRNHDAEMALRKSLALNASSKSARSLLAKALSNQGKSGEALKVLASEH